MPAIHQEVEQGFAVVRLANAQVSVAVVPELGAKVVSLRSVENGREWLWRPPGSLRLFRNRPGDDFARSTLIGWDECIPTVSACRVGGRDVPDHGDAWSAAWELDAAALATGAIRTLLRLPGGPLEFSRTVSLEGSAVHLDYELANRGGEPEPFLWAMHPLLTLEEGDRIRLPRGVRSVRVSGLKNLDLPAGGTWKWPEALPGVNLEAMELGKPDAYAKLFAGPLQDGRAGIENVRTGARLEFRWQVEAMPYLGIWITRGGWNGFHHPALEPTNVPFGSLADALGYPQPELFVPAKGMRKWRVTLDVAASNREYRQ